MSAKDSRPSLGAGQWIHRATHVARVFARYGFGQAMERLGLGSYVPRRLKPSGEDLTPAERLRHALQELGPVGVKLGQVLACRPDLLPPEYLTELRKLEDEVGGFPFEQARAVIEEEMGAKLEDLFDDFEEEPRAAASLAQVHRARLKTGQRVAVKVQRPGAAQTVEMDLQLLVAAARIAERYSRPMREARVAEFALEFAHIMRNELNYYIEAHRTDRLREALAEYEEAKVPLVYWNYTTRRVLTMEWCSGARPEEIRQIVARGIDPARAAENLGRLLLIQIFEIGFFHGDPHAGNILLQEEERIVFLDCGNMQSVSRKMRHALGNLVLAMLGEDSEALVDQLLDVGIVSENTDIEALAMDADRMLSRYTSVRQADIRVGEAIDQMLALVFKHRVRVPPILGAMARALLVAEGVARTLNPDFDFRQVARDVLGARVGGGALGLLLERLWHDGHVLARAARLVPRELARLLVRANAGGIRTRIVVEDSEQHLRRLDVMANRLAFGLVVAAFIVSSAMIVSSEQAMGTLTPTGGAIYVGTAAILGLWLLYSILRSGRL